MDMSVKDCNDFDILIPYLRILSESTTRINSFIGFANPVTEKFDDASNKLIETIVAIFAVKIGSEIDLDDPVKSSGGTNPDVSFMYVGDRITIACKNIKRKFCRNIFR